MDTLFRKTATLFILILLFSGVVWGQKTGLYISGSVLDADSLSPIEGAVIKNLNSQKMHKANQEGYFKINVLPGDTLLIQQKAFKPTRFFVPADLKLSQYALVQLLQKDAAGQISNQLSFPSQQQFEKTLMMAEPGSNTERVVNMDLGLERITNDPTNMQKYIDDYMRYQQLYVMPERGAPNNFINPERWTNFIRDWREGRFTDRAVEKLDGFPAEVKDNDDQ